MSATCVGWQLQTNAVGSASTWLPWRSGDGTECDYVHEAGASARLVWQWEVSGGEALDLGAIGFDGVQANAMNARVPVLGLGGADSATLKLEWGCTPTALANEVSRTVTRTGEEVFEIKDLLPGRRCFVRATLSTDGGAEFVSDIATCDTLAGDEPAGARELILGAGCAYVSSVVADGQPGDGVTVTGKVEFPPAAGDCAWHLLVWKKGASGAMRIAANDVTVDAEGNFDLTVVTDDPEAADYIQPGQSYELSVETDLGDGTVTTSPICGFATASAAAFKNNLFEVSYDCRVLTVKGGALSAGAGDAARITLMVGAGEDSLEDVDEGEVRKSDLNFELSYKVPAIEQTYWWALRLENETAGKTVCWTNVLPAASVVVRDNAHYIWTGAAGNGLWSDCGNWQAQHSPTDPTPVPATDCRGCPNGEQASLSFTDGTDAKIEIDCDVTVYALGLKNQAGAKVILSSASGRTVTHVSDIEISGGNMNDKQMSVVFDGVKVVTEGAVNVKNGCEVIFRNGAGIVCSDYRMRFDDGTFNGGTGTNLTVVSAGCEIKTTQLIVLASGAECVVSNGTLTVGNNLVFNCETDGGILRLEGDSPKVTVGSECRSTNDSRQQTASGGIVFDIPVGGYLTAPITLGGSFGGTDGQACQPLHINLLKASGAYGTGRTLVCPLLSTKGVVNVSRQVLGELKRPEKSAFVYSEAVDEPEWKTKDELLPEATPKLFGVRIGAARGLMILFQ